jgi:hypothetical protein
MLGHERIDSTGASVLGNAVRGVRVMVVRRYTTDPTPLRVNKRPLSRKALNPGSRSSFKMNPIRTGTESRARQGTGKTSLHTDS